MAFAGLLRLRNIADHRRRRRTMNISRHLRGGATQIMMPATTVKLATVFERLGLCNLFIKLPGSFLQAETKAKDE